jgi:PAS domain S-box-containing protein
MKMKAGRSPGVYYMSRGDFAQDIDALRQRIATFEHHRRQSAVQLPLVVEAVEALSAALEELQVAHEELQTANEAAQRQNEKLIIAQQRYQELFDFAPEAYLVTDIHGVIQEANNTAATLLKIHRDFLIGKPLRVFIVEEDSRAFLTQLSQLRRGGRVQEWEVGVQPREGPAFPAVFSIAPAHDAQGQVIGMRWLVRDISERKQAAEIRRHTHDTIERRVRQRTADLGTANAGLEAALQQKDTLLKEVHHRVKNNLQVVSSLLSLQSGYSGDPRVQAMFTESQQRIQSMALIHEILYQSRDLGKINMADYVRTIAPHLVRSYHTNEAQIALTIDADEAYVDVNTAIPCGLLLNELISNCLKHAFPDGRRGEVSILLRSDPAGQVTLSVGDDGVGFAADVDFRNSDTLGLQLVSSLVQQLQGTITMARGSGCVFTVTFAG